MYEDSMPRFGFMKRRSLIVGLIGAAVAPTVEAASQPANFPGNGRVTLVVPFAPGGTTDIVARLVAQGLSARWNTAVIVENRTGAGGNIGAAHIARSRPDGYNLLVGATFLANAPALTRQLPYDIATDFSPVTMIATSPLVLMVSTRSGIASIPELIARLKAKPSNVNYGSSGVSTSINLSTLMFLNRVGGEATHIVYRGSGPALTALATGELDMLFDNYATGMPFIASGQVKGLALTGLDRATLPTDLPTLSEAALPNFESLTWIGLLAPGRTPVEIVSWINAEVAAVLNEADTRRKLLELAFSVRTSSPEEMGIFMQGELAKTRALVRTNNIEPE